MKVIISQPFNIIDEYSLKAFIRIFNMITIADNIVELNMMLIDYNVDAQCRCLSGYFAWEFTGTHFILRQRKGYNSPNCYEGEILIVSYLDILHKDMPDTGFSLN